MRDPLNYLKRGILVLALLIPVFILLFLNFFGENKFSVPVFFSDGGGPAGRDCQPGPGYRIGCLPLPGNAGNGCDTAYLSEGLTIISFYDTLGAETARVHDLNLDRVLSDVSSSGYVQSLSIYTAGHYAPDPAVTASDKNHLIIGASPRQVSHLMGCVLFLPDDNFPCRWWVLVDTKGRIRGFYDSGKFEEMDRLILEIRILLKE